MKDIDPAKRDILEQLLSQQQLAVLATAEADKPYTNIIGFVTNHDYSEIIFATPKKTRKYHNLSNNPNGAVLIDNRCNQLTDFSNAAAVTATGSFSEITTSEENEYRELYLAKHPYLADFINSPDCTLVKMTVGSYILVSNFQEVTTIPMH